MRLYEVEVDAAQIERLRQNGFDVTEPLYHGTSKTFDQFKREFSKTAADFYLTPDIRTAAYYGAHVYLCYGRQDPQADLIDDYRLIADLSETFADEFYGSIETDERLQQLKEKIATEMATQSDSPDEDADWFRSEAEEDHRYKLLQHQLAKEHFVELIQSGKVYELDFKGFFQDSVMSECFGRGYRSVRFYDHSSTGDPVSVVFGKSDDVAIVEKLT